VETTSNTKKRKNGKFGLTMAVLVLLPLFLLRLAAGQSLDGFGSAVWSLPLIAGG
jgi:hypothetical protein